VNDDPAAYRALSADGHVVRWRNWHSVDDAADHEELTLAWDNEAWTASGQVMRENVQYVMRISPIWQVRQFLLFRDLDEPDLWLGTDGNGHWGEMNGAHRPELDGCLDVSLDCTPFTSSIPIRRLTMRIGESTEIIVAAIDVETLDVQPQRHRYTRLGTHRWNFDQLDVGTSVEFEVDEYGLVVDHPNRFRRLT
jgi:hypothetical protein